MVHRYALLVGLACVLAPLAVAADTLDRDISGTTIGGQTVSFHVHVDFTQTGGNFGAGTGTADVAFTLTNTSPLVPFQSPARFNALLTAFYFNVPPGSAVNYSEARVLAGATEYNPGAV